MNGLQKYHTVFLYGYGASHRALGKYLEREKIPFQIWDDTESVRDLIHQANPGWTVYDFTQKTFQENDLIVFSPGIKRNFPTINPVYERVQKAGATCCCDVDLFILLNPNDMFFGITGTNGKSTTVAVMTHALKKLGYRASYGGNIGVPVFDLDPFDIYVLELSSFQLDLMQSPLLMGAILLNITPDHLDYHGTMENYIAAKTKIFSLVKPGGAMRIADKNTYTEKVNVAGAGRYPLTTTVKMIENQKDLLPLSLRGPHAFQNLAAVAELLHQELNISLEQFLSTLTDFKGLPHRQQLVGCYQAIQFINDSKATNVASALKALDVYDNIYWLVGGVFKEGSLEHDVFQPYVHKIKKLYCYGRDAAIFYEQAEKEALSVSKFSTLIEAVNQAWLDASSSGVTPATILLSPCCASFDGFKNYEERGDVFSAQAVRLIEQARSR